MNQKIFIIHEKLENIGKHCGRSAQFRATIVKNMIDPFIFYYEKSNNNRNHMVKYKTLAKNVTDHYMVIALDY